ncbi:chemotaxis protein [Mycobacterium paragordonae]|nr:chemotaxis protein [Mycobacterium paragordonae]
MLAGTGWTVGTVRAAAQRDRTDLATAALADGFAAAARGLADPAQSRDGAA